MVTTAIVVLLYLAFVANIAIGATAAYHWYWAKTWKMRCEMVSMSLHAAMSGQLVKVSLDPDDAATDDATKKGVH